MDKRVILAVAGSGKTSFLIEQLNLTSRFMMISYTTNNTEHLRELVMGRFGYIPKNIRVMTLFQFLYRFCYRPLFKDIFNDRGISWNQEHHQLPYGVTKNKIRYYISASRYLFHERLSLLCLMKLEEIKNRLNKYYDYFFVDEMQDLAGYDFDFILKLGMASNVNCILVGDFYQHTYDSSRDGNKNSSLYNNFDKFLSIYSRTGFTIDQGSLKESHRCSPQVCQFVKDKLKIEINSDGKHQGEVKFINNKGDALKLFNDDSIVKLFYANSSKYRCNGMNWGDSKGLNDFDNVCVILNNVTTKLYKKDDLSQMASLTKNKFYVACTRAKSNVYLIPEELIADNKFID